MADSVPVELEGDAYSLMFLHACKHPTKAVNGLLLGTADADGVHVTTVLPLFHSSFALSPMLEAALMLADEHCKSSGKLQLVGYYQANELSDDCDLGPFGKKVAQKIRAQCAQAAVLLLDGSKMRPTVDDLRLVPLDADGKQTYAPVALRSAAKVLSRLDAHLDSGVHQRLVDFDAHLDDAQKDWYNTSLLK